MSMAGFMEQVYVGHELRALALTLKGDLAAVKGFKLRPVRARYLRTIRSRPSGVSRAFLCMRGALHGNCAEPIPKFLAGLTTRHQHICETWRYRARFLSDFHMCARAGFVRHRHHACSGRDAAEKQQDVSQRRSQGGRRARRHGAERRPSPARPTPALSAPRATIPSASTASWVLWSTPRHRRLYLDLDGPAEHGARQLQDGDRRQRRSPRSGRNVEGS